MDDLSFGEWLIILGVVVPLAIAVIYLAIDMLRRKDLSWWAKLAWAAFFVFLPVVAAVVYLITRPTQPADIEHEIEVLEHEAEVEAEHQAEVEAEHQAEVDNEVEARPDPE